MRPTIRHIAPAFALAAACATTQVAHQPRTERLRAPGPTAHHAACDAFAGRPTYALDLGETTERQVLGLACYDSYERPAAVPKRAYVQLHARFDDRRFDALTAALMVVACAGDGACRADAEPESLGHMVHYAQSLKLAKVQQALQFTSLPFDVQKSFLARVEASRDLVLQEERDLDPRRHKLYVELPAQVRARQAAHWKTFASFYEKLDLLVARVDPVLKTNGVADPLITQLIADTTRLRDGFLAKCAANKTRTAMECMTGPIARPLTQRIVQLAIRKGDGLLAQAEHALLQLGPDQSSAAVQIAAQQVAAVDDEQAQHERWAQAKEEGVDEATLTAAYGAPPPVNVPSLSWEQPKDLVGFRAQLRQLQPAVEVVRGTVRYVRPRGEEMEVYFYDEEVDGADCDQLLPEELSEDLSECMPDSTRKVPVGKVYLAMNEAKPLLIGNRLEAVIDHSSRKGLPVKVFKSRKADQLVQLRAVRWRQ